MSDRTKKILALILAIASVAVAVASCARTPRHYIAGGISSQGASGYQTVQSSGTAQTQRTILNFTGSGVSVADNSGSGRTDVTISGSGGSPTGAAGGDLGGSYPNPTITQITGAAGNVNLLATSSVFGSGQTYPVYDFVVPATTTNSTPSTIFSFAVPDNTVIDIVAKCAARNTANTGDAWYAEFQETVQRFGGAAPSLVGSAASASNTATSGTVTGWAVALTRSSNSEIVQVTGAAATTIHWSCQVEVMQVQ